MSEVKIESKIIAERLCYLRKEANLSFLQLSNTLKERYDISISHDSLKLYEITEYHSRANANLGMRIEYLNAFADLYGVTTDYILGRTNDPNPQPCAVDELGISPEAIEQIKHIARYRRDPLNYFLASEYLPLLLENFKDFQEVAQSIKEDTKHFNEMFEAFGISAPIDVIKYAKTYKYQENREYLQNTAISTVVHEMEANVSDLEWFVYRMKKDIQTITDDYLTKNGL